MLVAFFAASDAAVTRDDHIGTKTHEFFGEFGKPFEMFIGVAIFDHDIPALVIALLVQSLEERFPEIGIERPAIWRKPADKGRRPRLRERRDTLRDYGATEEHEDFPPVHGLHRAGPD